MKSVRFSIGFALYSVLSLGLMYPLHRYSLCGPADFYSCLACERTCRQFTNYGADWVDNCPGIQTLRSVWIRRSTKCDFFTDTICRGTRKSAGGGECLKGAFESFACNTQ
ncbi:hypothetical protein BJX70DRAFT_384186 [Aspergillus crustosus]